MCVSTQHCYHSHSIVVVVVIPPIAAKITTTATQQVTLEYDDICLCMGMQSGRQVTRGAARRRDTP